MHEKNRIQIISINYYPVTQAINGHILINSGKNPDPRFFFTMKMKLMGLISSSKNSKVQTN